MSDTKRKEPYHWLRTIPGHRAGVKAREKSKNPEDREEDDPVLRAGAVPPNPWDDIPCGYWCQKYNPNKRSSPGFFVRWWRKKPNRNKQDAKRINTKEHPRKLVRHNRCVGNSLRHGGRRGDTR